ncbi:hypothetical protein [Streptomyces anandii]|uniref:hypothetical protein n=1 Tax=Streptomyces anandii TaxID=285454 RepID=UPI00167B43C1|nr:hypothetical protein [Streptomyces anandii]
MAAELLDRADQLEFEAQLRAAAKATDGPADEARIEEVRLAEAVTGAIDAERKAEDAARDAVENHRQAVEAERQGHDLSAVEQTRLGLTVDAAAKVMARLTARAEGARAHREATERQLVAVRQLVSERTASEETAYALAKNPPKAPTSAFTGFLDGFRRLMLGQSMSKEALAATAGLVQDAAKRTGLARHLQAQAVEQRDKELANLRFERNMPKAGHSLRPSNPTSPVFAVRPRS